jgi:hypothetical protein
MLVLFVQLRIKGSKLNESQQEHSIEILKPVETGYSVLF